MKNFIQKGNAITVLAASAVISGAGTLVEDTFGVAAGDAESGEEFVLNLGGVYALPAVAAQTANQGKKAYWKADTKEVTSTASGNFLIGFYAIAKEADTATAAVRLNGTV